MIRSRTLNRALGLLCSALMLVPSTLFANPLGGQVVGGQATIQNNTATRTLTITQGSQNAIINWYTFNIGAGETTQFIQPNASAIALNRVTGGLGPSLLNGTLTANGRIFLVNPNGVLIGSGGVINTAGFLASTNDIRNADFMAGNYKFTIPGRPDASIVNLGNITATGGGFAALVAPGVRNAGVITANLGHVGLASGNGFTLDFYGDQLITLQVGDKIANKVIDVATGHTLDSLVKNEGVLRANGGQVALTAVAARHVVDSVINNKGVIEANSVGMKNGMIVLGAATAATKGARTPKQTVRVSGTLSAAGQKAGEKGGIIQVTGEKIVLRHAKLDASGQAGGGTVLIGGDTGGGAVNPAVNGLSQAQLQPWSVPTATSVSIDAATVIDASAKSIGDGGKVVVWSNEATKFKGQINATGGANGGNGGFAEVSSLDVLRYAGSTNLGASNGVTGTLLLNAANARICADCEGQTINSESLSADLNHANVVLTTSALGDNASNITVTAPVTWNSPNSLTLSSYSDIAIDANVTSQNGGAITLRADNTGTGVGTVRFGGHDVEDHLVPAQVSASGAVTIFYNPDGNHNAPVNPTSYTNPNDYSANVAGGGSLTAYMLVNIVSDLQNVQNNLNGTYALGRNIDASATATWNYNAGFVPIDGNKGRGFSGLFNGEGHTIDGLTIAPTDPNVTQIGLFGVNSGTIENLNLTNVSVASTLSSTTRTADVGSVAGTNIGTIRNVSASGEVNRGGSAGAAVGGLVGVNGGVTIVTTDGNLLSAVSGVIENSHAAVNVIASVTAGDNPLTSGLAVGGLVGATQGASSISHSSASGTVTATGPNVTVGGLIGFTGSGVSNARSLIDASFATGNVSGVVLDGGIVGEVNGIGGLVGVNTGTISQS